MHTESSEVPPQRSAAEQVRTAISSALRQLYEHDQAQPLPDQLVQLLGRLDDVESASSRAAQHDQTIGGNREGAS